jgi:hypothetical protein
MLPRFLFAAVCFLVNSQAWAESPVLGFAARYSTLHQNFSPPIAYRDVMMCSYVAKVIICHRISHAYRPLPGPFHMPSPLHLQLHGRR